MADLLRLGALNKLTKQYIHPDHVNKNDEYICIDCGNDVNIRMGNIRIHHFAHYKQDSACECYATQSLSSW